MYKPNIGDALTWDEIADLYDAQNRGRPARTLPMDGVFTKIASRTDEFYVCPDEGTLHLIVKEVDDGDDDQGRAD